MKQAIWNGVVLAESDNCQVVENNFYFPPDAIHCEFFKPSQSHTTCPWKGIASYYDIVVSEQRNADAAWYYPEPKPAAVNIKNYIAFWKGVKIIDKRV